MDLKKYRRIIIILIACLFLLNLKHDKPKEEPKKEISITGNKINIKTDNSMEQLNDNDINNNKNNDKNNIVNNININQNNNSYIAKIIIPKINLNKKLFSKNSPYNDVNKNIQILKESTMPDIENSNLILAAHSGNSKVAYFTKLKDLSLGDSVFIEYENYNYEYNVYKIVVVNKDGKIEMSRNSSDNYLTLITCKLGTNKQYVIICKLKNKQKI